MEATMADGSERYSPIYRLAAYKRRQNDILTLIRRTMEDRLFDECRSRGIPWVRLRVEKTIHDNAALFRTRLLEVFRPWARRSLQRECARIQERQRLARDFPLVLPFRDELGSFSSAADQIVDEMHVRLLRRQAQRERQHRERWNVRLEPTMHVVTDRLRDALGRGRLLSPYVSRFLAEADVRDTVEALFGSREFPSLLTACEAAQTRAGHPIRLFDCLAHGRLTAEGTRFFRELRLELLRGDVDLTQAAFSRAA
jgi:hypothetical protein